MRCVWPIWVWHLLSTTTPKYHPWEILRGWRYQQPFVFPDWRRYRIFLTSFSTAPSLSLLMRTELPGRHFGVDADYVLIYIAIPFGSNGAKTNCAITDDVASCGNSLVCTPRPGWFIYIPSRSKLYSEDGLLFDFSIPKRHLADATT